MTSLSEKTALSVLLVHMDYKMSDILSHCSAQTSDFRSVIRIFGSTDEGRRICVHVHNVMPSIRCNNFHDVLFSLHKVTPYIYFRPDDMRNIVFESEDSLIGL